MESRPISVAIVGVGAIGSVAADSLLAAGLRPSLCVRRGFEALVIETPSGVSTHRALRIAETTAGLGPQDLVVVATKAHQTESARAWLERLTGPKSVVLVIQNGVEHVESVRPLVADGASVVPSIIDVPAQRIEPGLVSVRRAGSLLAPDSEEGRWSMSLFTTTHALHSAAPDPDFERAMWKKLAVNVVSGAIPSLTDRPGGVFREPEVQRVARGLVSECVAVARAQGIDLEDELVDEVLAGFVGAEPSAVNSMLRDRREGRLLEADSRNGAVARKGAAAGIATPYNDFASVILNAVNAGPADERS